MNKEIKYIGYFDFQDSKIKRQYVTSATNKMQSVCDMLNECGYDVLIVSMSSVCEEHFKFFKGKTVGRKKGLKLKTFFSWGGKSKVARVTRTLWHLTAMFIYLLFKTQRGEPIIIYHSLGYFNIINWAKKIRKFKMILEVEEIYQDVSKPKYNTMAKAENKMIENADAYIFPTELLNEQLNKSHKPHIIMLGTYNVEPQVVNKFEDGKIHIVYAGTFDPIKGGAAAAISAAKYLPENYHIHICGFGTQEDEARIKKIISETIIQAKATVTFEGLKLGRDFIEFIQKCHIGLSTQNPNAAFNATSFPSKILTYMANGLSVVSVDIPAIRLSQVGQYLQYYSKQNSEQIANAILSATIHNNNREIIARLRYECETTLPEFFKEL